MISTGPVTKLTDKIFYEAFMQCCVSPTNKLNLNICVPSDADVDWFLATVAQAMAEYGKNIPVFSYDTDIGKSKKINTSAILVTFLTGSTLTVGTEDYWCRIRGNNWEQGEGLFTLLEKDEMRRFRHFVDKVGLPCTVGAQKDTIDTVDTEAFDSYINDLMTGGR